MNDFHRGQDIVVSALISIHFGYCDFCASVGGSCELSAKDDEFVWGGSQVNLQAFV